MNTLLLFVSIIGVVWIIVWTVRNETAGGDTVHDGLFGVNRDEEYRDRYGDRLPW